MRGLKLLITPILLMRPPVASFTDAWIETGPYMWFGSYWSRIFYRCVDWNDKGKVVCRKDARRIFYRCVDWNDSKVLEDEILRCRIFYRCVDWNCKNGSNATQICVASFTDAWIETSLVYVSFIAGNVASFTDAWIETIRRQHYCYRQKVASFTDAWIETFVM